MLLLKLAAQSEPPHESITWYIQATKLRTSPFSAPHLDEASLDTRLTEAPPPLLDTHLKASIQNITSLSVPDCGQFSLFLRVPALLFCPVSTQLSFWTSVSVLALQYLCLGPLLASVPPTLAFVLVFPFLPAPLVFSAALVRLFLYFHVDYLNSSFGLLD